MTKTLFQDGLAAGPDLAGQKTVVVGLGRTGLAVAEFLLDRGAMVIVTDSRPENELGPAVRALAGKGAALELGGHRPESLTGADLIVVSPGVPLTMEPLKKARAKGVRVTGEIELASLFVTAPIVAITGTNGKTTTTSLIGEMIEADGRKVFVGGNIGRPLIEYVNQKQDADVVVIEVSSFQLETAETLRPKAAALLNVTPDHLDRYPDFEAYAAAKIRLFARQGPGDTAVINADDPISATVELNSSRLEFSRKTKVQNGAFVEAGRIVLAEDGREVADLPLSE
ncbi:MAG: UDP-N-acetylmuramoyl-L-alanine--D-glutamate ligase, partial [Thermodesulfobacteriota bacterium]|nr:UDP-N-acetylmuramoyl-L-alanine--D-glutamate ligase [Thermodesulfobacteriota bacterium]